MYVKVISWLKKVLALTLTMTLVLLAVGCTEPADKQKTGSNGTTEDIQVETDGDKKTSGDEKTDVSSGELIPEPGATLKFWESSDDGVEEWAREMIQKFTEKYGIEVTFDTVSHTDAPENCRPTVPPNLPRMFSSSQATILEKCISRDLYIPTMCRMSLSLWKAQ